MTEGKFEFHPHLRWVRDNNGEWLVLGGSPTSLVDPGLIRRSGMSEGRPDDQAELVSSGIPRSVPPSSHLGSLLRRGMVRPNLNTLEEHSVNLCTVIVPHLGSSNELERCLGAIRSNYPTVSLIVVDDFNPNADAIEKVTSSNRAQHLRFESNRGPAAARNAGAQLATTPLLLFVDSDVSLTAGSIEGLTKWLETDDVVAVAPRVRAGKERPAGRRVWRSLSAYHPLDLGPLPFVITTESVESGNQTRYVPTATLLMRRDRLVSLGGFDETLRFGEDVDLVWKVADQGGIVVYDPTVTTYHRPTGSLVDSVRKNFRYGTSLAALALRWPDRISAVRGNRPYLALLLASPLLSWPGYLLVLSAPALTFYLATTAQPNSWTFGGKARLAMSEQLLGQAANGLDSFFLRTFGWLLIPLTIKSTRVRRFILATLLFRSYSLAKSDRGGGRLAFDLLSVLIADTSYGIGVLWGAFCSHTIQPFRIQIQRRRSPVSQEKPPSKVGLPIPGSQA